jgi:DNA-binding beta-propeller fold protein YncE
VPDRRRPSSPRPAETRKSSRRAAARGRVAPAGARGSGPTTTDDACVPAVRGRVAGTLLAAAAGALLVATPASAAPPTGPVAPTTPPAGWSIVKRDFDGGVKAGGELAVDPTRGRLFVADRDFYSSYEGGQFRADPHLLTPHVSILRTADDAVERQIDWTRMRGGNTEFLGAPIPMPQVPVGLAVDPTRGLVVTTNTFTDTATIVSMDAAAAENTDLIDLPGHPMGIGMDIPRGRAYIGMYEGGVAVLDLKTRKELRRIPDLPASTFIAVDPDSSLIYVGDADFGENPKGQISVVDTATDKVVERIPVPVNSRPILDVERKRIYAASVATGRMSVIDTTTRKVVKTIPTNTTTNNIAFDPETQLLYTSDLERKTVTVVDGRTDELVATVPVGVPLHTVTLDTKTHTVYASHLYDGRVTAIDVRRPAEQPAVALKLGRSAFRAGGKVLRVKVPAAGVVRVTVRGVGVAGAGRASSKVGGGSSAKVAATQAGGGSSAKAAATRATSTKGGTTSAASKVVTLATGRVVAKRAGTVDVRLSLTAAGKRLRGTGRKTMVRVEARARPTGATTDVVRTDRVRWR